MQPLQEIVLVMAQQCVFTQGNVVFGRLEQGGNVQQHQIAVLLRQVGLCVD